jgi:hypothetical protein
MEPEVSLPSSQELSTYTYPEPDQSSPQHSLLFLKGPKIKMHMEGKYKIGVRKTGILIWNGFKLHKNRSNSQLGAKSTKFFGY